MNEYHGQCRRTPGAQGRGAESHDALLEQIPDRPGIEELSDELYERLCRDLEQAERIMEVVKHQVEPHTWEAFWLTAIQGLTAREAAERLMMTTTAVSQAKYRVGKRLRAQGRKQQESTGGDRRTSA